MEMQRKKIFTFFLAIFFVASLFSFSNVFVNAASENEIKDDIKDYEKKLEDAMKILANQQAQFNKNQSQISASQSLIKALQADIARSEEELKNLSSRGELNKKMLAEYMRQMYYVNQEDPLVFLSIFNGDLNDLTVNFDGMVGIKTKISNILQEINDAKGETEEAKTLLAKQKQKNQEELEFQREQQVKIASNVQEAQLTVAQIQQKISKLRNTLSGFLGKSYDVGDVVNAVEYAAKKTGVRKEFIFAMLDKETDLGRFTGGCYYDKGSNPVKKHMKSADKTVFLEIMNELGYDKNDKKLSCWPGYGYGGAMGIAQFMPTTWTGYKSAIASMTGNKPANPWRLEDGVIGMALKLKKAGATSKSKEHYAAKVYYCGGPSSPYWKTKCEAYADTVISWSKGYDEYFK